MSNNLFYSSLEKEKTNVEMWHVSKREMSDTPLSFIICYLGNRLYINIHTSYVNAFRNYNIK